MKRTKTLLMLAAMALFAACTAPAEPNAPLLKKSSNGGMVLWTQSRFAVSVTGGSGASVRGFRLEDAEREALGAVLETTANRARIDEGAPQGFTSAVSAQDALIGLVARVKRNITFLLPQASEFEEDGDWSITPIESAIVHDAAGNVGAYGRYRFEYAPLYQLRSTDMLQYLAAVLVGQRWGDYPKDAKGYFPAGRNILIFSIGISLYEEDGFYQSQQSSRKIAVSFAVSPENKRTSETWDDLDDVMTFKTLGTMRDEVVKEHTSLEIPKEGNAVDIVIALDRGANMLEEVSLVKGMIAELANRIVTESDYQYRVGFVTQGSPALQTLDDGTQFIDLQSGDPAALVASALDDIMLSAEKNDVVPADLVRTAALAMTGEAVTSVNKSFRRPGAPLLLVTVTDRDDASPAIDGAAMDRETYPENYAAWLRHYDHWIVLAPSKQCLTSETEATEGAQYLAEAAAQFGAAFYDMCGFSRSAFEDAVLTWAAVESSLFKFDSPQPFPFTLQLSVNGKAKKRGGGADFTYDVLGDRLVFQSTVAPKAGDVVEMDYYRIQKFQMPGK